MKNFHQPGGTITLIAPYDVASGGGLKLGAIVGVATSDTLSSEPVEVILEGVFELAKAPSQAWTVGAKVYWDDTNKFATTAATSNTLMGVAVQAVPGGAGDLLGLVRLNGSF